MAAVLVDLGALPVAQPVATGARAEPGGAAREGRRVRQGVAGRARGHRPAVPRDHPARPVDDQAPPQGAGVVRPSPRSPPGCRRGHRPRGRRPPAGGTGAADDSPEGPARDGRRSSSASDSPGACRTVSPRPAASVAHRPYAPCVLYAPCVRNALLGNTPTVARLRRFAVLCVRTRACHLNANARDGVAVHCRNHEGREVVMNGKMHLRMARPGRAGRAGARARGVAAGRPARRRGRGGLAGGPAAGRVVRRAARGDGRPRGGRDGR